MRLLLVEDNEDLGDAMARHLQRSGHSVEWVRHGEGAVETTALERFDAAIVDLTLPGRDGVSVIEEWRRGKIAMPILVVTARSEIDDKIGILDRGADDYIVKPFDLREMEARLRALLRRQAGQTTSVTVAGDVVLDGAGFTVLVAGRRVELGRREFRLLEIFMARLGTVTPKERLMGQLFSHDDEVLDNALELYVSRLRRKLAGCDLEIVTVRGVGYGARLKDGP